tara:strand:+ start:4625 stop:4900 length:276 start_codon:yes stop_codon:yes gene_type:complete
MTIARSETLKVRRKPDLNLMINPTAQEAKKANATPVRKKTTVKRVDKTPAKKVKIKEQAPLPFIQYDQSKRPRFKGYPNRSLPASINEVDW